MTEAKDEIIQAFQRLDRSEQLEVMTELRKVLAPASAAAVTFKRGARIVKSSSKDCSIPQRVFLLGVGHTGLQRIDKNFTFDGAEYDQIAANKWGGWILSKSEFISCRAGKLDETNAALIEHLKSAPLYGEVRADPLRHLNKGLSMRSKDKFSRLYFNRKGEPLFVRPYYPNIEVGPLYLDAVPWQRSLYILDLNFYTKTGVTEHNETNYLILKDDYQLAVLPLKVPDESTKA